ncbi:MAG TPA: hypothetical protein PKN13_11650 [Accumulibacter sp.]|nr:hypothetical protein [Accumulibacter sp.]HMW18200.1 hypothetical protein [Accumulibacter sp.]HMX22326.1 hypothetical protein [Accumulibacter sp.]HMY05570.1 hypothetical protein [Accumulibacter sp.]HNC18315.1 hypothetical protein [Accumulibacter sp.]
MVNPYQPPIAKIDDFAGSENNSGGGSSVIPPPGVKGWSWGAFWLNWVWAIGNKTWIGLLSFLPYIGLIFCFYLGFKGRELAWRNKRWDSLEHFNRIQRRWSIWGWAILLIASVLGILAAVLTSPTSLGPSAIR